jgi:hypothetical protein
MLNQLFAYLNPKSCVFDLSSYTYAVFATYALVLLSTFVLPSIIRSYADRLSLLSAIFAMTIPVAAVMAMSNDLTRLEPFPASGHSCMGDLAMIASLPYYAFSLGVIPFVLVFLSMGFDVFKWWTLTFLGTELYLLVRAVYFLLPRHELMWRKIVYCCTVIAFVMIKVIPAISVGRQAQSKWSHIQSESEDWAFYLFAFGAVAYVVSMLWEVSVFLREWPFAFLSSWGRLWKRSASVDTRRASKPKRS